MQVRNRYLEISLTPVKVPTDGRAQLVVAASASTDPHGLVARHHNLHFSEGVRAMRQHANCPLATKENT